MKEIVHEKEQTVSVHAGMGSTRGGKMPNGSGGTEEKGVDSEMKTSSGASSSGGWMDRLPSLYPSWIQNYLPEISLDRIRRSKAPQQKVIGAKEKCAGGSPTVDAVLRAHFQDLLYGAALPLDTVAHVFAYGSAAVPQRGEDPRQKMVDFLVVCNDSLRFHQRNLLLNPAHYCLSLRLLDPERLDQLQRFSGARLYFNTRVFSRGRLIKYGVIHVEDLETDLLDWRWLYTAGRLQKPVVEVFGDNVMLQHHEQSEAIGGGAQGGLGRAMFDNYRAATHAALLQLDSHFSMEQFLHKIVSISYTGDVRQYIGAEDPHKVEKLVSGAAAQLRALYTPILAADHHVRMHADDHVEQDCSTPIVFFRLTQLPRTVLELLSKSYYPHRKAADTEELLYPISHRHDLDQHFSAVLQSIVYQSSLRQSFKNFLTAGPTKSVLYVISKFMKRFRNI